MPPLKPEWFSDSLAGLQGLGVRFLERNELRGAKKSV